MTVSQEPHCDFSSPFYEVGGKQKSPYLQIPKFADTIALTFDDGPDEVGMTNTVLDVLAANNAKATFFINTKTHSPLATSPVAQESVRRMEREGHRIANHTASHPELASLSSDAVAEELTEVELSIDQLLGERASRLTLMRAPYGRPFNPGYREGEKADAFCRVAEQVAPKAVHVYWDLDPRDWEVSTAQEVVDRVEALIAAPIDATEARRGILLLHSDRPQTAAAMPAIMALLKRHNITVVDLETYVQETHGAMSNELISSKPQ